MIPRIDVVIPALNEEKTIGPIVRTFRLRSYIQRIIVVIDVNSRDETAYLAEMHGATEVIHSDQHGKGQNMRVGLASVRTPRVIFCDSDLYGLDELHVYHLAAGVGLTIGVPDEPEVNPYPATLRKLRESWGWLSGVRSVATTVVSRIDLHGYCAELQINEACRAVGIKPFLVPLPGLYSPVVMSEKRLKDMERDRKWGIERGILEPPPVRSNREIHPKTDPAA
jgi:glycosyltransferase involved in cell wall biosynthesis